MDPGLIIRHFDDQRGRALHLLYRVHYQWQKLAIDQGDFGFAVVKDIGDRIHIQPCVDCVQYGPTCGHPERRFGLGGDIGEERCDNITRLYADLGQRRCQTRDPSIILRIG